jgi:hypothetical protein
VIFALNRVRPRVDLNDRQGPRARPNIATASGDRPLFRRTGWDTGDDLAVRRIDERLLPDRTGNLASALGLPAINLPVGMTSATPEAPSGLPVGIDLTGASLTARSVVTPFRATGITVYLFSTAVCSNMLSRWLHTRAHARQSCTIAGVIR